MTTRRRRLGFHGTVNFQQGATPGHDNFVLYTAPGMEDSLCKLKVCQGPPLIGVFSK